MGGKSTGLRGVDSTTQLVQLVSEDRRAQSPSGGSSNELNGVELWSTRGLAVRQDRVIPQRRPQLTRGGRLRALEAEPLGARAGHHETIFPIQHSCRQSPQDYAE